MTYIYAITLKSLLWQRGYYRFALKSIYLIFVKQFCINFLDRETGVSFFEHLLLNIILPATSGTYHFQFFRETWCYASALHKILMLTEFSLMYYIGFIYFLYCLVDFLKNSIFHICWCYTFQKIYYLFRSWWDKPLCSF